MEKTGKFCENHGSTSFVTAFVATVIDNLANGIDSPVWIAMRILLAVVMMLGIVGWAMAEIMRRGARNGTG